MRTLRPHTYSTQTKLLIIKNKIMNVLNKISIVNDGLTVRVITKSNVVRDYNFVSKSTCVRYYCSLVY